MLRRTYLGLDIRQQGLRAVAVQRRGKKISLIGGDIRALDPAVIRPDFLSPNVGDPDGFVRGVKELLRPLTKGENRVSVALPDQSGRLFLLDIETPFKNRAEGEEIVRWQLKDLLPEKTHRFALDYQILEAKESGHRRILAAVISRDILEQYEALFEEAGFAATIIDFHALSLYNAYRTKIDFGHDFILIGLDDDQFTLMVFVNQRPSYWRSRRLEKEPEQVFSELNRSLAGYRHQLTGFNRIPVYLHSDWQEDELINAVASAFDQTVHHLASPVQKLMNGHQLGFSGSQANSMAAALGAAERMIQRVV